MLTQSPGRTHGNSGSTVPPFTAGIVFDDVAQALFHLAEMRLLPKKQRGVYRIHPSVMWRGELANRGVAEAGALVLTLAEGGKVD